MRESEIESYFVYEVGKLNGFTRKLQWQNRHGAPDRLLILDSYIVFVEFKATNKTLDAHQEREIAEMKKRGAIVWVIDSKDDVDDLLQLMVTGAL